MKAHRKEIVGIEQGDKANANPQSAGKNKQNRRSAATSQISLYRRRMLTSKG